MAAVSRSALERILAGTKIRTGNVINRTWTSGARPSKCTCHSRPILSSSSEIQFKVNSFTRFNKLGTRMLHQTRTLREEQKPRESPPPPPSKAPLSTRLAALRPSTVLHENIWTLPNILTFSRLAAAPVIGYMLLHDQHLYAFSLFVYAGITDLVDGWIARTFNSGTVVGTVIDPMADKTLMTIATITLAMNGSMPMYLAGLILGRDVFLILRAMYYRYISLPPPKTFARYWDFSLPSAEVRPTGISKVNTALQLGLIGATMGMPLVELGAWAGTALMGLQYTVALTTVWSGASYLYTKDSVKILSQQEIQQRINEAAALRAENDEEKKA